MKMSLALTLCLLAIPAIADPAPAQRRGDQTEAFEARRQGKILPRREIERRIVPQMRAEYLGVEFDSDSSIYTLKFLRNGTVIWVDVDGRSGQILRQTGQ